MNGTRRSVDVSIKPASPEHLAAIAELAAIIWHAHYPGIISREQIDYMLVQMYNLKVLRSEMDSGMTFDRVLVGGKLWGFSSFGPSRSPGEFKLHKLYVHPDCQRRGIGGALLKRCEHSAQVSGAQTLVLNVNKKNGAAISAYRKNGFTIRESVIVKIGGGFVMDDYVMVKPLGGADLSAAHRHA